MADAAERGEDVLFFARPATKAYWFNKEQFMLIDGVCSTQIETNVTRDVIIPRGLRAGAI